MAAYHHYAIFESILYKNTYYLLSITLSEIFF